MNRFMALLTAASLFLVLIITVMGFSQNRDDRSRAYKSLGCENNNQCPTNTECKVGLCVIVTPSVTQTPLALVDATTLQEAITPIPAVYVSLIPTPEPGFFEQASQNINNVIGSIFIFLGNLLNSVIASQV